MFGGRLSRDGEFFDNFNRISDLIHQSAIEFKVLCDDLPNLEAHAQKIKDLEHAADSVTHKTFELLESTFITPLDREDIHQLISHLDDVIDFIDAASQRVYHYEIQPLCPEVSQLADIIVDSTINIQKAVHGLKNLKNPTEVLNCCVEVNRLENEGDQVMRRGIGRLFREESDLRKLIKLKEICELLETVTDRCEDVTGVIQSIVLENS